LLTAEEKKAITAELAHHDHRQGASIEALKIVQAHRGYVSDESLRDLAQLLETSPEELDSVATFYNLIFRRPVGRHVILLCDSVSCWILGYEAVRAHLEKRLGIRMGETTPDGRFTLLTVPCLGACDRGPAMMIGERLYTNLSADAIDAALEKHP